MPVTAWELSPAEEGDDGGAALAAQPPGYAYAYTAATVPTTVVAALDAAGAFGPEPLYRGTNLRDNVDATQFATPWRFRACPALPAPLSGATPRCVLEFEGLNYRADVWVNGAAVASSADLAGPFRHFRVDITAAVAAAADPSAESGDSVDVTPCIVVELAKPVDDYWTRNATDLAFSVPINS